MAEAPAPITESLIHGICCVYKRGDIAFCSTDLTGRTELPKSTSVECIVCDSIEAVHRFTCPHDGEPCPHHA
jgi:hypothetical protein